MVANLRRMLDIGNLDKNSLKGLPGLDGSSMEAWDCEKQSSRWLPIFDGSFGMSKHFSVHNVLLKI